MNRKVFAIFILFGIVLLCGCNSEYNSVSQEEAISAERYNNFWQTVSCINDNFYYEGYSEIMNEKSYFLSIPEEAINIIDEADDILSMQKLFVYKNKQKGAVILLQITFNKSNNNYWNSSIDYDSDIFNNTDSYFASDYNQYIPDVYVAVNAFSFDNCFYQIICLSDRSEENFANSELTDFSNSLIRFLMEDRND